jgi:hypothetical protein
MSILTDTTRLPPARDLRSRISILIRPPASFPRFKASRARGRRTRTRLSVPMSGNQIQHPDSILGRVTVCRQIGRASSALSSQLVRPERFSNVPCPEGSWPSPPQAKRAANFARSDHRDRHGYPSHAADTAHKTPDSDADRLRSRQHRGHTFVLAQRADTELTQMSRMSVHPGLSRVTRERSL